MEVTKRVAHSINKKGRGTHPAIRQKRRLIEFISKHPHMITCKITEDHTLKDYQKLWRDLAYELNSMPGAKKTWKQWRKMWQDLRSRVKRKCKVGDEQGYLTDLVLTEEEKTALGLNTTATLDDQREDNNISFENTDITDDSSEDALDINFKSSPQNSPSPTESKVFVDTIETNSFFTPKPDNNKHSCSEGCALNLDMLSAHEEQKLELKKEYFKLKSRYLKQKIKLMKEHNEALRSIADALRNNSR